MIYTVPIIRHSSQGVDNNLKYFQNFTNLTLFLIFYEYLQNMISKKQNHIKDIFILKSIDIRIYSHIFHIFLIESSSFQFCILSKEWTSGDFDKIHKEWDKLFPTSVKTIPSLIWWVIIYKISFIECLVIETNSYRPVLCRRNSEF